MVDEIEQLAMDAEESAAIEDMADDSYNDKPTGQIERFVTEKFHKAQNARRFDEERWIQAYRNYRGIYGPDVQFTSTEKSRVSIDGENSSDKSSSSATFSLFFMLISTNFVARIIL